jgi:hypothetical protein
MAEDLTVAEAWCVHYLSILYYRLLLSPSIIVGYKLPSPTSELKERNNTKRGK